MPFTLTTVAWIISTGWVDTPKHIAELSEGHSITRARKPDPETGKLVSNHENGLANTHILWHGDQLLALDEGSHPFELEPMTLASKGVYRKRQRLIRCDDCTSENRSDDGVSCTVLVI